MPRVVLVRIKQEHGSKSRSTMTGFTNPPGLKGLLVSLRSKAPCYLTIRGTVVECCVEGEVPVIVMVYVVEPGPPRQGDLSCVLLLDDQRHSRRVLRRSRSTGDRDCVGRRARGAAAAARRLKDQPAE